jgi:peptide alpha-N-acetyltransferase
MPKKTSKAAATAAAAAGDTVDETLAQAAAALPPELKAAAAKVADAVASGDIERLAAEVFGNAAAQRQPKDDLRVRMVRRAEQQRQQQLQMMERDRLIDEHQRAAWIAEDRLVANRTQHPDVSTPLEKHHRQWTELAPGRYVRAEQFSAAHMGAVMKLFAEELPEPYSVFTYEHFLMGWPDLGVLLFGYTGETPPPEAEAGGELIGSIVSSIKRKKPIGYLRGYIAMLAVRPQWRGHRLGQRLVRMTVELLKRKSAFEVCLETPVSNERAMKLYTDLGFAKTKFLTRYYLDGSDAIRLKLWFASPHFNE